jgi:hypothetical protein
MLARGLLSQSSFCALSVSSGSIRGDVWLAYFAGRGQSRTAKSAVTLPPLDHEIHEYAKCFSVTSMRFFRVFRVFRGYKKTLAQLAPGNSQSSRLAPSRRILVDSPSLKKLRAIPVDSLR